ncbi:MAG: TonB-dependent receptor, partial [Bacteroidales bacterium]|nr:TonB-dependent receptor [Bacteroidales bacterium]
NCSLTVAERDDPGVCAKTDSVDFEYPAWVVGLDYQLSDNLFVYAKTSGASMSGGWNVRATTAPSFEPENVTDIELGLKSDLFDDRLRLNAAVFHIWYDDQQRFVNELDPVTNTVSQYVQNAGKSTAQGAEFELTLIPWEGMTLTGTLSLLDTEYDKYEVLEPLSSGPNAGQGVLVDHSGEESPQAPEMSFTVGATQIIPTALGEVSVHADYFWVDDTYFQDNTVRPGESAEIQAQQREEQKYNAIPSYGLVNAMAKLTTSDGRWEFSLWGRNLADKEYYKGVANFYTAIGTAVWLNGDPRTYGVSARYNW